MTEEQVRSAVMELQTAGIKVSYKAIIDKMGGGSRRDLAQLLPLVLSEDEVPPPPKPTLREQYTQTVQTHSATTQRVAVLTAQAQAQGLLSEEEEVELLRLRMRLEHLAPHLAQLRRQVETEQQRIDIDAVVEVWTPLTQRKGEGYAALAAAVEQLRRCFYSILQVHGEQEALIESLPKALQERLMFIDSNTLRARIAQGMPAPQGWVGLLCVNPPLAVPSVVALTENDPGMRPLPPRILAPFQQIENDL